MLPVSPSSVLLYPNIDLKDVAFVKEALLLYDNLYRIVPPGVEPNDHEEIQQCNEEYEIVSSINPEDYVEGTYEKFIEKAEKWSHKAAGFSGLVPSSVTRLHENKVYHELREYFINKGLLFKLDDWLVGNDSLIENYMIYLSKEVATNNQLSLLTDYSPAWTVQEFIKYDGEISDCSRYRSDGIGGNGIIRLYLNDFIPEHIEKIPFSEIIAFRDDYKNERKKLFTRSVSPHRRIIRNWRSQCFQRSLIFIARTMPGIIRTISRSM